MNKTLWKDDILECLDKIDTEVFTLSDFYQFEEHLSRLHPNNNHIRAKIRQQLQVLRNDGIIEFVDNAGTYKKS